jgi:hypothetical protein
MHWFHPQCRNGTFVFSRRRQRSATIDDLGSFCHLISLQLLRLCSGKSNLFDANNPVSTFGSQGDDQSNLRENEIEANQEVLTASLSVTEHATLTEATGESSRMKTIQALVARLLHNEQMPVLDASWQRITITVLVVFLTDAVQFEEVKANQSDGGDSSKLSL